MALGEIFLAGHGGQSRAGKIAPSWALGQPITAQDLIHLARLRSQPYDKLIFCIRDTFIHSVTKKNPRWSETETYQSRAGTNCASNGEREGGCQKGIPTRASAICFLVPSTVCRSLLVPANSDEKTVMDTKRFREILGLRFSLVRSSQFSSSYPLGKLFASRNR